MSLISATHDIHAGISEQHLGERFSAFIHNQWPLAYYFCCSDSFAGSRDTPVCPLLNFQQLNFNLPKFVFDCKFLPHCNSPDTSHDTAFPINPNGSHEHTGLLKQTWTKQSELLVDLLKAYGPTQVSPFLAPSCSLTVVLPRISWAQPQQEMENILSFASSRKSVKINSSVDNDFCRFVPS